LNAYNLRFTHGGIYEYDYYYLSATDLNPGSSRSWGSMSAGRWTARTEASNLRLALARELDMAGDQGVGKGTSALHGWSGAFCEMAVTNRLLKISTTTMSKAAAANTVEKL
jgi:hypothetical protein